MRTFLSLAIVMALAGCGGGGGGSAPTPQQQQPAPTSAPVAPQGNYVTPTFTLKIPARSNSAKGRTPKYVSSATLSVVITLTADSVGIVAGSIPNNPATTPIAAGTCSSGCTVSGPPSPPGTDSFTIVTYDNATPASGHALNAAQKNSVPITQGANNAETVTLGAIPATLTAISNAPTNVFNAGTQAQTDFVSVIANDAAGNTIPTSQSPAVTYVDATGAPVSITIADPDANAYGTCVESGGGTTPCTSGAGTSVTLAGPDSGATVRYDGLAENPVTLTASAPGVTSITASIQPNLNAPVFNGTVATPSGVALPGSAEIDLFNTSGIGSTGTESFTESGWTNSPYGQALLVTATPSCTSAGPLSSFAAVSAGSNSTTNGTPFTATESGATPTAGACPVTVGDGLSTNSTDGSATLTVTYTTSSIGASSKHRR